MMDILKFIGKRLIYLVVMLFGVATLVFILTKMIPGDPTVANLSQRALSDPQVVAAFKAKYGLDQPIIVQYVKYIGNMLHLDLGTSIRTNNTVLAELARCYPATIELALFSIIIAAVFGIFFGIISAVKRNSIIDQVVRAISVTGVSIPSFWFALIMLYLFYFKLKVMPGPGRISNMYNAPHLVTNAAITGSGTNAYLTFSVPQETITQGNALVAVRSGNTVLWSWHIWVTDTNLAAGISANGKVFSPANLGWCDGKSVIYAERTYYVRARQPQSGKISRVGTMKETGFSETYKGNNTYYQWGRKDPMQAGDGKYIGSNGSQNFKYYYSETGYAPVHNQVGKAANLGTAIQNPHREYRVTNAQDNWLNTGNTYGEPVNIWDSGVSYASATYSDRRWGYTETYPRDVDKTVYDPCPVGYKVPNVNSFTGFTTSNLVWTNNYNGTGEVGRYYTGNSALFFPADGGYSQSLIGVALEGSYWCATAAYTDGADMFNFSNSAIRTGIISNSFQFVFKDVCWAVRPIRE